MVLLLILFAGFAARLGIASVTNNADGATLTWGSAFVARGMGDPYRLVVKHAVGDPIPLNTIRSLSLAQGPIGVVAGALPLWIGERLDLIDLGSTPDGHRYRVGELLAFKTSYFIPELIVLWSIARLVRNRRHQVVALLLWALSPLSFFCWGQGLPDAWTIAVILTAAVTLRRARGALTSPHVAAWLAATAAVIAIGSLGTKLVPLILLVPLAAVIVREHRLQGRHRLFAAAAIPLSLAIGAVPYALSPFMRANVLLRFEFDMLFSSGGITTASAIPAAPFGMIALVALTLWLLAAKDPWPRVEPWIIGSILLLVTTSGIITHLLVWAVAALVLLADRNPRAAVLAAGGLSVGVAWHVLTYEWLTGIVADAQSSSWEIGGTLPFLTRHVPAVGVVGGAVGACVLLGTVAALWLLFRGGPSTVTPKAAAASLIAGVVALGVCLVAAPVMAADSRPVWDLAYSSYPTNGIVPLAPGQAWTSAPITGRRQVNYAELLVDRTSQPSLDRIEVALVRSGTTIATASSPVWTAEPKSDRGFLRLRFPERVEARGAQIVVRRVPADPKWQPTRNRSGRIVYRNSPYLTLAAVQTPGGPLVPNLRLGDSQAERMAPAIARFVTRPAAVAGVPLGAALVALIASAVVVRTRRRHSLLEDTPSSSGSLLGPEPVAGVVRAVRPGVVADPAHPSHPDRNGTSS